MCFYALGIKGVQPVFCFVLKIFIFSFLERGEGREKEREKNINQLPLADLARNPGMCPDWESNQHPFSSQAGAQSTEPHKPGPVYVFENTIWLIQGACVLQV